MSSSFLYDDPLTVHGSKPPKEIELYAQSLCRRLLDSDPVALEFIDDETRSAFEHGKEAVAKFAGQRNGRRKDDEILVHRNLSCAIYGPWGAGKTSLLRVVEKEMKSELHNAITVWFDPWRHETEKDLIVPLLVSFQSAVEEAVSSEKVALEKAKDYGKRLIGRLGRDMIRSAGSLADAVLGGALPGLGLGVGKVGEAFLDAYAESGNEHSQHLSEVNQFKKDLEALISLAARHSENSKKVKRANDEAAKAGGERANCDTAPIIVFIDDLDRCSHQQVKRLLESIKIFLQAPGVIFVLALDEGQVVRALAHAFKEYFWKSDNDNLEFELLSHAKRYLEKFFQVEVELTDDFFLLPDRIEELKAVVWKELEAELDKRFDRYGKTFDDLVFCLNSIIQVTPRQEQIERGMHRNNRKPYCKGLKKIFRAVKDNPRGIKGQARWAYYTCPFIDASLYSKKDDKGRIQLSTAEKEKATLRFAQFVSNFAEQAFSTNFGSIWVNELRPLSMSARRSYYRALLLLLTEQSPEESKRRVLKDPAIIAEHVTLLMNLGAGEFISEAYGPGPDERSTPGRTAHPSSLGPDFGLAADEDENGGKTGSRVSSLEGRQVGYSGSDGTRYTLALRSIGNFQLVSKLRYFRISLEQILRLAELEEKDALKDLEVLLKELTLSNDQLKKRAKEAVQAGSPG